MLIGGHRGSGVSDSGVTPSPFQENSLDSIRRAFEQGAGFIECDWVWDGQGEGWICHSMRLSDHFPNPSAGFLDQLSTAEVSSLVGLGGLPLCSLRTLIREFAEHAVNLEIKGLKGIGRKRVSALEQWHPNVWPDAWWFSSFDPQDLLEFQDRWPQANLALLSHELGGGGAIYSDGGRYLSGSAAIEWLRRHPNIAWHPEITDRPVFDRRQIGWSMNPDSENRASIEGLHGLITDRLDAWLATE